MEDVGLSRVRYNVHTNNINASRARKSLTLMGVDVVKIT